MSKITSAVISLAFLYLGTNFTWVVLKAATRAGDWKEIAFAVLLEGFVITFALFFFLCS